MPNSAQDSLPNNSQSDTPHLGKKRASSFWVPGTRSRNTGYSRLEGTRCVPALALLLLAPTPTPQNCPDEDYPLAGDSAEVA